MSHAVAHFLLPSVASKLERPLAWLVRQFLRFKFRNAHTVRDVQQVIDRYVGRVVKHTASKFTVSGLDRLPRDRACLFISNHRDIVMDPALSIMAMFREDHETARIAIGDNLLTKQFVVDLMRLNKSFIVKRSSGSRREKLAAATQLSNYIYHSIVSENEHVWLAQREGRAKDGLDRTNPALIAMLAMSRRETSSLADLWRKLHIVPLSISYEWDPCDRQKAKELYITEHQDEYRKSKYEDLKSIAKGITGDKGNVHAAFGTPIEANSEEINAITDEIDRQIINNYVLHPTNLIAYQMLYGDAPELPVSCPPRLWDPNQHKPLHQQFQQHLEAIDSRWRDKVLAAYANPVVSRLAYQ
ncbi:MAG: 1-acyl-sn-glycerol-3-phosphate acyltransferase [Gammaproteobacteria bacterium]|nr:1-acyl-sn-glycerol-3-phosphate acyltransferase [Gammaproteobacteria bacterium]